MIDEPTYNELDRYFHSQMNAGEKAAFDSRLNASEELRAELMWLNAMIGSMHQQGRSVMKQTIASAIAGVPMKEVSKYKPSVNGKSFLKKWWWAIASVIVAAAVAVGAYRYVTRHHEGEFEGDHHAPTEQPAAIPAPFSDSVALDSCLDEMPVTPDSAAASTLIDEQVSVEYNAEPKVAQHYERRQNVDSVVPVLEYGVTSVGLPAKGQRIENMNTRINRRTQPPYTYVLDDRLTLNANYNSTAGFVFEGAGDTVYMTDNSGLSYRLLRNKGEQPLKPIPAATKRAR